MLGRENIFLGIKQLKVILWYWASSLGAPGKHLLGIG
jgi:hypothetical protein